MYRADFIQSVKEQYITQTFRGYTQSFGDDRHLTNLALMRGYKVVFLQQMTATTDVPTNLKQFLKQQLRWNQSFVRENLVLFPYALKHNFALAFELIITTVIPLIALPLRLSIFAFMIFIPSVVLHVVIAIIIMSMLRNVWMLQQGSLTLFLHNISYGLLHFLAVYWLLFIAMYKVFIQKNTLWGTRG
jgi:cellulose synthase/poly-beta-1,6-N-acetylglucosamine synthase-like glycosyltransferase